MSADHPEHVMALEVHAEVRVERGTAQFCACGGLLRPIYMRGETPWTCLSCGRQYA